MDFISPQRTVTTFSGEKFVTLHLLPPSDVSWRLTRELVLHHECMLEDSELLNLFFSRTTYSDWSPSSFTMSIVPKQFQPRARTQNLS